MKVPAGKDVPGGQGAKPLTGQKVMPLEDETGDPNTQQVTVRVSTKAVAVLQAFGDKHGVKRNRLFDEAIQMYAAILTSGMRVTK